jgi:hypothetical protein
LTKQFPGKPNGFNEMHAKPAARWVIDLNWVVCWPIALINAGGTVTIGRAGERGHGEHENKDDHTTEGNRRVRGKTRLFNLSLLRSGPGGAQVTVNPVAEATVSI